MTRRKPLEVALSIANEFGLKVFPCRSSGPQAKAPLTKNGFKDASREMDQINDFWTRHPDAFVGVPTGEENGIFVIDIDVGGGKKGEETWSNLNLQIPLTWQVSTLSGGRHIYFEYPANFAIRNDAGKRLGKDIDVRGEGGYVIFAGSFSKAGEYRFIDGYDPRSVELAAITDPLEAILNPTVSKGTALKNVSQSTSRMSFAEAVATIAIPLGLRQVGDRYIGAPCPGCGGGTEDRFTLRSDDSGNAWLICNAGCSQQTLWRALAKLGLVNASDLYQKEIDSVFFPDVGKNKVPRATLDNTRALLSHLGIITRYDVIAKDEQIFIPGATGVADNRKESALTEIVSECSKYRMSVSTVPQMVFKIADENPVNPIMDWIESIDWDGKNRFEQLFETLETEEPKLSRVLLRKWLVSAIAAVHSPIGHAAQGVLVLQGEQGLGKTRWVEALCPPAINQYFLGGFILEPKKKDSILTASRHWIVELGELDATFRRTDIAALKAYLTNKKDVVRKPFARVDSEMPRRTVFTATVNELNFLADDTGNDTNGPSHDGAHQVQVGRLPHWSVLSC